MVETHLLFAGVQAELFKKVSCVFSNQWGYIRSDHVFLSLALYLGLGQYALERLLFSDSVLLGLCTLLFYPLPLLELQQLIPPCFLIHNAIINIGPDGRPLNGRHPFNLFLFLLILRFLLDHIHFPERQLFRMKIKVLLIIVNGVEKILLRDHAVQLAFGVAEELC